MIKILIKEEYGYREWVANLTQEEYADLLNRWETMRGLNCLVPVPLIIPQAVQITDEELIAFLDSGQTYYRCHIHEHDDSYLEGSYYRIPEAEYFYMEGIKYEKFDCVPQR